MTLVDTSAWIEFFRRRGDRATTERVAMLLEADAAAYTCPVYFELLVGAGSAVETRFVKEALDLCPRLAFDAGHWERAAVLERHLRRHGLTVPRDDVFVAVVAEAHGVTLLCRDRHFDMIRRCAGVHLSVEQC